MKRAVKTLLGVLASLLLVPAPALAWPVDQTLSVERGADRFHKLSVVDWVEVEDPSVATVEVLAGSSELLMTGLKPGRTLVLLYAEGKFAVWRLTVTEPGAKAEPVPSPESPGAALAAARQACPGLRVKEGAERLLEAPVKDSACRAALLELLKTDAFLARELELTFELAVLQEQLAAVSSAIKPLGLEVRYSGAGVVLQGAGTPEAHRQALWALFRLSAGRVPLEDRVKLPAPPAPPVAPAEGTPEPVKPAPAPKPRSRARQGLTPP